MKKTAKELIDIGFDYPAKGYDLIGDWIITVGEKVEYDVTICDKHKIVTSKKIGK